MKCINLGCGSRYHPEWINVDITALHPHVRRHDLRQGMPFEDGFCDVVYHSHVLEHFSRADAARFLKECFRILRAQGIIRVVVPDLEQIARIYLGSLESALSGIPGCQHDYDWMMLELCDQMVRDHPGGDMLEYLKQDPLPNLPFVLNRGGTDVARLIKSLQGVSQSERSHESLERPSNVKNLHVRARNLVARTLLGEEGYKALQVGRFRLNGEVHQWMYDRFSLARTLLSAGFITPRVVGPTDSQIPGWKDYHLDTERDGSIYKPDSLYMEALKP